MKPSLACALLLASLHFTAVPAQAANLSAGSEGLSYLSGLVVLGSIVTVGGAGSVVVESVKTVGEGIEVVIRNVADGSRATVQFSGKAAHRLSVGTGAALEVVASATGHLLVASGKVLAFIPNELGKVLLHHSEVKV